MTSEPRDKRYGTPLSEAIERIPNELPFDAVGIFQIVPHGRDGFGLEGEDLADFVRRSIHGLLDAGAVPVRGGKGTGYEWVQQKQYGTSKREITEALIAEWQAMPDDPLVLCGEGIWFALPAPGLKYVKVD
jgi:hypothetical protein